MDESNVNNTETTPEGEVVAEAQTQAHATENTKAAAASEPEAEAVSEAAPDANAGAETTPVADGAEEQQGDMNENTESHSTSEPNAERETSGDNTGTGDQVLDNGEEDGDFVVKINVQKMDTTNKPFLTKQGSMYFANRRMKCVYRCGRKTASYFLMATNFLFAMLALGIIGSGSFVLSSSYAKFFDLTHIIIAIVFGVFLLGISVLGCYSALVLNRKYLLMYTGFTTTICILQIISAVYVYGLLKSTADVEKDGFDEDKFDSSQRTLVNSIKSTIRDAYDEGECETCSKDPSATFACAAEGGKTKISVKCKQNDAAWFAEFIKGHCDTDIADSNSAWEVCTNEHTESYGKVFCSCRESLVRQLNEHAVSIFSITVSLCVLEALIVACAVRLIMSKSGIAINKDNELRAAERAARRAERQKQRAEEKARKAQEHYESKLAEENKKSCQCGCS